MAAEDQDSRTEAPTGKRLEEAWKKGNVAISREIGFAAMLLASLTSAAVVLPWSMKPLLHLLRSFVERPESVSLATPADIVILATNVGRAVATAIGPPMLLLGVTGVIAVVAQLQRFMWATEKLKLNWVALNPLSGIKRIFGARAMIEWAKSLIKLSIVALVTFFILRPEIYRVENLIGLDPAAFVPTISRILLKLVLTVIGTMIVIAGADVIYQRWSHYKSLKMTKQEVKDEVKSSDGDPTVKNKQRAKRQARAKQRMLQAVPKASVIITNPTHFAVALQYEKGMNAPKLLAKGVDFMAKRIRDIATENDVPIVENPPVARAIYATVEIDTEIPAEHYKAVAEIISYVMKLKRVRA